MECGLVIEGSCENAVVNERADLVAKKIVNALIPTAQPRFPVGNLLPDCLDFQPNTVNRFVHNADVSRRVALADIASVSNQFGVVTRIVTVTLRDGTDFKFRCFGAPKFVQKIRAQMQLA